MTSGEGPYFEQSDTLDHIEAIADQPSLVIYAGAGVSIDRTNVTWRCLIEQLMEKCIDDQQVRQRLKSDSPLRSASIVKQMYINKTARLDLVDGAIASDVRSILYSDPERELRRAGIARSIARLVAEMKQQGKKFYVITTNYDDSLQQEIRHLNAKRGVTPLQISTYAPSANIKLDDMDKEVAGAIAEDRIVHLHGYVHEEDRSPSIILSEADYAKSYPLSSNILERLFKENSVLILGSSLTDPPLVNALANSKEDAEKKQLVRVAIMPIQGFDIEIDSGQELREAIRDNVRERMEHFAVDVTFPDFFSQVAQLVTEIQICFHEKFNGHPYRDSPRQYGNRLHTWWITWEESRLSDWFGANERDHSQLKDCIDDLQNRLKLKHQSMEIEIWIRWKPGTNSRQLRLWASSNAPWPEVDARSAPIAADSKYVSVQTFSNGRIDHHPLDTSNRRRLRRYLCVPIKLAEHEQKDLPVAVMSLAYSLDNNGHKVPMAKLVQIAEELGKIGRKIAGS